MNLKSLLVAIPAIMLLLSGCSKTPLLPDFEPVNISKESVQNLSVHEINNFIGFKAYEKMKNIGGSSYYDINAAKAALKHFKYPENVKYVPSLIASGSRDALADGRYVIWEKDIYAYTYSYPYNDQNGTISEEKDSKCVNVYLSGTSHKTHTINLDCEEFLNSYHPGQDFQEKVLWFRNYLKTEFPKDLSEFNAKNLKEKKK